MPLLPALILLTAGVAVGLYMAFKVFKGERNKPVLIGLHFFVGAASLEVIAVGLSSTPGGFSGTGSLGKAALLGVGMALFSGIMQPLIGRDSPNLRTPLLAIHAIAATTAFGLVILLAMSLRAA